MQLILFFYGRKRYMLPVKFVAVVFHFLRDVLSRFFILNIAIEVPTFSVRSLARKRPISSSVGTLRTGVRIFFRSLIRPILSESKKDEKSKSYSNHEGFMHKFSKDVIIIYFVKPLFDINKEKSKLEDKKTMNFYLVKVLASINTQKQSTFFSLATKNEAFVGHQNASPQLKTLIESEVQRNHNSKIFLKAHTLLHSIHYQFQAGFLLQKQSKLHIFRMSLFDQDKLLRVDFDKLNKKAAYGTAGFRDLAVNMPYIAFRVGVLVAILNKTQPDKHLGVVISASHNKREDNGVKITNFRGNMLEKDYQPKVEEFVNEPDLELAVKKFKHYLISKGLTVYQTPVTVLIGGDTRPSTQSLLSLISDGVSFEKGITLNFHLTTTPQLQYYVYLANVQLKKLITSTEEVRPLFQQNFSRYFTESADYLGWKNPIQRTIDCANGIGAKAMPNFIPLIEKYIKAQLSNTADDEFLNKDCGTDHVKTKKILPRNFQRRHHDSYLSFDGDADRIVFYTQDNGKLNLIDGDRTGTVLTQFFNRISKELKQKTDKLNQTEILLLNIPTEPTIGFVQTYYANYSSSEYLKKTFGMEPLFAATGVKNLHEKAEHYDIGIYFEANGHGTVIFNEEYLNKLEVLQRSKDFLLESPTIAVKLEFKKQLEQYFQFLNFYINVCKLSNPSVGDAICVFLLFELALFYLKKDYKDTLKLYQDLESLTSKIAVKAKENLKVTEIEDKVVEPVGLQARIEGVLEKHKGKKAFLRASGTENVLRLHVEADTVDQVKAITEEVKEIVVSNQVLN